MAIYYSIALKGFLHSQIVGKNLPDDAVQITVKKYRYLLDESNGRKIVMDEHGELVLEEFTAPTQEQLAMKARYWRIATIAETDYLVAPDYPLSDDERKELYAYRQSLRDWPSTKIFPADSTKPTPPEWVLELHAQR